MKRRDLIKIAAAGFAAPWMSAISHAKSFGSPTVKRILIFVEPYGRFGEHTTSPITARAPWIKSDSGDYALDKQDLGWMLQPLENHLNNLAVFSGVFMRSRLKLGGGISHDQINSYTLTGSRVSGDITTSATVCAHPSINNFIGDHLNSNAIRKFAYNSLAIGNGGKYNYGTDGLRVSALPDPKTIYNTAFGISDKNGFLAQQSVISQVKKQIDLIAPELVQANASNVVDAYRHSIDSIASELETRINLDLTDKIPENLEATSSSQLGISQMFDAIYDLFACGLTPSILYGYSGYRHGWLRDDDLVSETANNYLNERNYHYLSHRNNEDAGATQGLVMRSQVDGIAKLADRLKTTPELDGSGTSMMDNTVIFYTQAMCRNTHGTTTPYYHFLLAGDNTNINGGWHYDCHENTDNELMTTVAQAVGMPITQFGGYSGSEFGSKGAELNRGPISKSLFQTFGS